MAVPQTDKSKSALHCVFLRELSRIKHSKVLLFTILLAPLISFFSIWWIFSAGVVRDLPIVVLDHDQSQLSRSLARDLHSTAVANVLELSNMSEARRLMDKGTIEAIVLIPENFERDVNARKAPIVRTYVNNANLVKGGLLYSGMYKVFQNSSQQIQLKNYQMAGLSSSKAEVLTHPILLDTHVLFNPFANYAYFLSLGVMPIMLVVLTFLVSAYALGIEFKNSSTKELLDCSNGSIVIAMVGKMLPYTILLLTQAMVMNLILFRGMGITLAGSWVVLLFSELLLIIVYQLLAILFLNVSANMRLTLSLGSAYTMMALTFAGVTFPSVAMPQIAQIFSWFFPYTFWVKIFLAETIRAQPLASTVPYFLILLLFIIVSFTSFFGLKRKMQNSNYWGRS